MKEGRGTETSCWGCWSMGLLEQGLAGADLTHAHLELQCGCDVPMGWFTVHRVRVAVPPVGHGNSQGPQELLKGVGWAAHNVDS